MTGLRKVLRLVLGRWRCAVRRAFGARIGAGSTAGPRMRVDHARRVAMGTRCEIESDVWFKIVAETAQLRLGDFVFVGRGVEIDCNELVEIGNHVLIAPGVFITDHAHGIRAGQRIDEQACASKPIRIGDDVWIGAHAVILPGVEIGNGAVVGAGAVVARSVSPYTIVAGVPAREIGRRASDV